MAELELHKHTLFLVKGDFETLQILYPEVKPSVIIRTLIHKHIEDVQGEHRKVKIDPALIGVTTDG